MIARLRLGAILAAVSLVGGLLAAGVYLLGTPGEPGRIRATLSVAEALRSRSDAGFARALLPRAFSFPRDHGPHPGYRTEWWYYTGNLQAADGPRFGFQLTFFRDALTAAPVERTSAWGTSQVYMAHFALTDVAGRRFRAFERLGRAALGLAGATPRPFRVWVEDWSAEGTGGAALPPMRLRAAADGVVIDLALRSAKPLVLNGDRGLSQKGPEPGNASYYYSLTRMETSGAVTIGADTYRVSGLSWMDREWSTSALGADQVGWDWFALHLADGRDVMFYQIRRRGGGADRFSRGTVVAADGSARPLAGDDVRVEALAAWRSPRSGAVYPSRWRFRIPGEGLDLEISPYLADQELDLSVRYWEGAARVAGTANGRQVSGDGYVELTGYGDANAV